MPLPQFQPLDHDKLRSNEVNLVAVLLDDSGSIRGHELKIVNAYNVLVEELLAADGGRQKYWLTMGSLNGILRRDLRPIEPAHQLDVSEYVDYGATPLYDATYVMLNHQKEEHRKLRRAGITKARTASVVLTDGFDEAWGEYERGSKLYKDEIAPLAEEMASSPHHQLFGIGIKNGRGPFSQHVTKEGGFMSRLLGTRNAAPTDENIYPTEYHYAFRKRMGFIGMNARILAVDNTGAAIARAMKQASQSIAKTSANARTATGF